MKEDIIDNGSLILRIVNSNYRPDRSKNLHVFLKMLSLY